MLLLQSGGAYCLLQLLAFDVDITNSLCVARQHCGCGRAADLGDSTQRTFLSGVQGYPLGLLRSTDLGKLSQPFALGQRQHSTTRRTERTTHRATYHSTCGGSQHRLNQLRTKLTDLGNEPFGQVVLGKRSIIGRQPLNIGTGAVNDPTTQLLSAKGLQRTTEHLTHLGSATLKASGGKRSC